MEAPNPITREDVVFKVITILAMESFCQNPLVKLATLDDAATIEGLLVVGDELALELADGFADVVAVDLLQQMRDVEHIDIDADDFNERISAKALSLVNASRQRRGLSSMPTESPPFDTTTPIDEPTEAPEPFNGIRINVKADTNDN